MRDSEVMAVPLRPAAAQARPGAAPVVSHYREYRPSPAAAQAITCTWQGVPGWPRRLRLLPDGCLDLIWDGQRTRAVCPSPGPVRRPVSESELVIGIRIRPGWAALVLDTSLRSMPDVADLGDVWDPAAVRRLETALTTARSAADRRAVLTRTIPSRLAATIGPDLRVLAAISLLGQPGATAGDAAMLAGLSSRQLRRRFADHVGLPPKTLQTILRFQRLRARLAAPGATAPGLACTAAECGYYDQAHLCRDCTRLAGVTPTALLGASASHHGPTVSMARCLSP